MKKARNRISLIENVIDGLELGEGPQLYINVFSGVVHWDKDGDFRAHLHHLP